MTGSLFFVLGPIVQLEADASGGHAIIFIVNDFTVFAERIPVSFVVLVNPGSLAAKQVLDGDFAGIVVFRE